MKWPRKQTGFTIVELIIVVVVIAILAALVTVGYAGVTRSAREASIKSDLKSTVANVVREYTQTKKYPTTLTPSLEVKSESTSIKYARNAEGFCITGSGDGGLNFYITQEDRILTGTCATSFSQSSGAQGGTHALALALDGTVIAWGNNSNGEIGDGTTQNRLTPVRVGGALTNKTIVQVAAGRGFSVALDSEGVAYTWGANNYGQLGDGATTARSTPAAVVDGVAATKQFIQLIIGTDHTLALASDGALVGWGYNGYYQIAANAIYATGQAPKVVTSGVLVGKTIKSISSKGSFTMVLDTEGNIYAWGSNTYGQVGDGTVVNRSAPVNITNIAFPGKTIVSVETGSFNGFAIDNEGILYAWGMNMTGQLANGSAAGGANTSPTPISTGELASKRVKWVQGENAGAFAMSTDNILYAWGANGYGQLGDGTTTQRTIPVAIAGGDVAGKTINKVGPGYQFTTAVDSDGVLYAWGLNNKGQVGDTTTLTRASPLKVTMPSI